MSGDVQVRFCERLRVRFPRATHRNVYVRSKRAGERVLAALRQQYAKLRLRVNEEKSTVARVWDRKFLGYSFWVAPGRKVKLRVAAKALEELKHNVREITIRSGGRSMAQVTATLTAYLRGWQAYFKLADTPGIFAELDGSWLCPVNTSSGSVCLDWPQKPQPAEPPDADPHVRWCGRGVATIRRYPQSRSYFNGLFVDRRASAYL